MDSNRVSEGLFGLRPIPKPTVRVELPSWPYVCSTPFNFFVQVSDLYTEMSQIPTPLRLSIPSLAAQRHSTTQHPTLTTSKTEASVFV